MARGSVEKWRVDDVIDGTGVFEVVGLAVVVVDVGADFLLLLFDCDE